MRSSQCPPTCLGADKEVITTCHSWFGMLNKKEVTDSVTASSTVYSSLTEVKDTKCTS